MTEKPKRRPPNAGKGRPRGSKNKATLVGRELADQLLRDPAYAAALRKRLHAGTAAPGVEVHLWNMAFGKPIERQEIGAPNQFAELSDDQLRERLAEALASWRV